jgi:hypothetical protein
MAISELITKYWPHISISGVILASTAVRKGDQSWYTSKRNREATDSFVSDMATNHLPHIYDILLKISTKLGLDVKDHPNIAFSPEKKA